MKKSTTSCFESQKTVNTNIIIVKMCEKCFVQTKTILIDVNFLLWKKNLLSIRIILTFQGNLLSKILAVKEKQKRAYEFVTLPDTFRMASEFTLVKTT